jgi:hypothetical protein
MSGPSISILSKHRSSSRKVMDAALASCPPLLGEKADIAFFVDGMTIFVRLAALYLHRSMAESTENLALGQAPDN